MVNKSHTVDLDRKPEESSTRDSISNIWGSRNPHYGEWNERVDEPLVDKQLTIGRTLAATLALALTILVALLARASHPPAGATTLLVALSSIKTMQDAINLMIGAVILGLIGELLRRVHIGKVARMEGEPHMPSPDTGR